MIENESTLISPKRAESLLANIGVVVLSMAAVLTVLELDHARAKTHTAETPKSATHRAAEQGAVEPKQYIRKDKEKTEHMMHSFGVMMRSHPTAGSM